MPFYGRRLVEPRMKGQYAAERVHLDSVIKISLIRQGTNLWRLYSIGSVAGSLRANGNQN